MRVTHTTTIIAKCPHGPVDVYEAEFTTRRLIEVEVIQAAIVAAVSVPRFQEDLTQQLADVTGCEVVTVGTHGRFHTRCYANPRKRRDKNRA